MGLGSLLPREFPGLHSGHQGWRHSSGSVCFITIEALGKGESELLGVAWSQKVLFAAARAATRDLWLRWLSLHVGAQ